MNVKIAFRENNSVIHNKLGGEGLVYRFVTVCYMGRGGVQKWPESCM